ncbi:MAG: DUF481 domain-containing protein [Planctomycetes bacterium]|nr:DUF481 domain-containing protein [Planctomycetota bacterium]
MKNRLRGRILLFFGCLLAAQPAWSQALMAEAKKPEEKKSSASVTARDGSIINGEVVQMTAGELKLATRFNGDVPIKWTEIKALKSEKPIEIHLKDGTVIAGTVEPGPDGSLKIKSAEAAEPVAIKLESVVAINPPAKKAITFKGNVSFGGSASDGNTNTKTASLLGEFEARSELQRFTLRGSTNYAENQGGITQRNSKGSIKYDFFFFKRWYAFASAFFEGDKFQDLNLRTALSGGAGYQIFDRGDFKREVFKELQSYAEFGVAYFDEDFKSSPDQQYVSARWSFKIDWPILPKQVVLFHLHEGYPSLERAEDIYITTEQGVRFTILKNFVATAQVNWRWDNTPSPGFERSDTLYLLTLGYSFEM